jgi:hypothetical protein
MPETGEEIRERLEELTQPGVRGRLAARGLARGMIWRNGILPPGAPDFSPSLSVDLLDYGYGLLARALRAIELEVPAANVQRGLVVAAEAIESAVRKGDPLDDDRDFHLFVSAAVFHLAQYAARSFCLLGLDANDARNLSTAEKCVAALIRGRRRDLRHSCAEWLGDASHSDDAVAARLANPADAFGIEEAERIALTATILRALAVFDLAISSGAEELVGASRERLSLASDVSRTRGYVPLWWTSELTIHLIESIWQTSLHVLLSRSLDTDDLEEQARWTILRSRFIGLLASRTSTEVQLWPSQIDAARRSIDPRDDLVVALPTSAGKTRIAELCILRCLATRKRVVYVTPLRALSAQVERSLAKTFGPLGHSVTALYGASGVASVDIGNLQSADIVVATPEKLDFAARQEPSVLDDVGLIILDEGHMIGLSERELHYEVLVQRLLRRTDAEARRLVCLSAVFSEGESFLDFTRWLRRDVPGDALISDWRPTRQRVGVIRWRNNRGLLRLIVDEERPYVPEFVAEEPARGKRRNAFPQNDEEFTLASAKAFLADGQRVLVYCPQRGSVENLGAAYLRLHRQGYLPNLLPDGVDLTRALTLGVEWLGDDHVAIRCLRIGVVIHHAAMPRAFLAEVEDLLCQRKLRLTISSPTLAQGIDLSSSVLIFRSIYRGGNPIPAVEYANVVGRAGRAFVDLDGITVFPIFDSDYRARRKEIAFTELRREAAVRDMESGILLLLSHLIELMTRFTASTGDEIMEYVLNTSGPWTLNALLNGRDAPTVTLARPFDADAQFALALEELDIAILGSVEDPGVAVSEVADALETALRTSYWSRRLARLTPDDATLQRSILVGRARWIWERSSETDRIGFYAAGVGFAAGSALLANLPALVDQLLRAEAALIAGQVDVAGREIVGFATTVLDIGPFRAEGRPAEWQILLTRWVAGDDLPTVFGDPSVDIEFIQDSVVYRLVWAVEAVRAQAVAAGIDGIENVIGNVALALTYGLPTFSGTIIAQAGLSSRRMIRRLLEEYPATLGDVESFREWIGGLPDSVSDLWLGEGERTIWRDFASRWKSDDALRSERSTESAAVIWSDTPPVTGQTVRLLSNTITGVTSVYDSELNRLGDLQISFVEIQHGDALWVVEERDGIARVRRQLG